MAERELIRVDWGNGNDPNAGRTARIVDLDTGHDLGDAIWADERTGEYLSLPRDEDGRVLTEEDGELKTELRKVSRLRIIFHDDQWPAGDVEPDVTADR